MELGIETPGDLTSVARLVNPDIVQMLEVKLCHTNPFRNLESIAEEKSQLLKNMKSAGCAIINQDNPYVAEMTIKPGIKVIRFGRSEFAHVKLIHAKSNWPDRLKLQVSAEGQ